LKKNKLFYNGLIYTQADDRKKADLVVDSMAISGTNIVAVGDNLKDDPDFKNYERYNLRGRTVLPGFTDAHTHFYFLTLSMGTAKLDGLKSLRRTLDEIREHCRKLKKDEWVIGEGFSPERWQKRIVPDRYMLDKITGGRPAAIWSKDQHMMWVNSRALQIAGITSKTTDPAGGLIERFPNGEPTGILKEVPAYFPVIKNIKRPGMTKVKKLYRQALQMVYSRGVTAVHSFDGPEALPFFEEMSLKKKLGLRIDYYPPGGFVDELRKQGIKYGHGNEYFRVAGLKMFSDGSLGSQSALCFNKYIGSQDNYGIQTNPISEMVRILKRGATLGLPCAIHAIGDKAIDNVLRVYAQAPALPDNRRHRIEHLQMIRRQDIGRVKKLGVVASMQPSHCPSDVEMILRYWGRRGRNCYIFKSLLKRGIPLAFGSDAPIEPLNPLAGIDAAVNRRAPGFSKPFYPEERIDVAEAVYGFTAGAAYAVGREYERGFLLPGYKADFIILSDNLMRTAPSRIKDVKVRATFFDGRPVYADGRIKF
jgi:predicted amidohydrolase YtcJ